MKRNQTNQMQQDEMDKNLNKRGNIYIAGDYVESKHVEYEIGNVESGGIGIKIVNGGKAQMKVNEGRSKMEDGACPQTADDNQNQDNPEPDVSEVLDYEVPTFQLQRLLKGEWFAEMRTDERYDSTWTDSFVVALMATEWRDGIARDWSVSGLRGRKNQLRGYVVGLLKDAGVLKGSYHAIASKVGILVNKECDNDPYKTFADYMARGKKQPYAGWVMEYVGS